MTEIISFPVKKRKTKEDHMFFLACPECSSKQLGLIIWVSMGMDGCYVVERASCPVCGTCMEVMNGRIVKRDC